MYDNSNSQTRYNRHEPSGGTLVGMTAVGSAKQMSGHGVAETFQFGGRVQGWQGRSPSSIDGQQNPTLKLWRGQVYQVTWTNLDGQPHDFALRNSDNKNLAVIFPNVQTNTSGGGGTSGTSGGTSSGNAGGGGSATPPQNAISKTEIVSTKGATQTLQFVATKDIEHYVCTVHPTTMVGRIETSSEGGSGGSGDHSGSGDHGSNSNSNTDHSGGSHDHSGSNADHMGGSGDHSGSNTDHSGNRH